MITWSIIPSARLIDIHFQLDADNNMQSAQPWNWIGWICICLVYLVILSPLPLYSTLHALHFTILLASLLYGYLCVSSRKNSAFLKPAGRPPVFFRSKETEASPAASLQQLQKDCTEPARQKGDCVDRRVREYESRIGAGRRLYAVGI